MKKKKSIVEFTAILSQCKYKHWEFEVHEIGSSGETWLQLSWVGPDTDTDEYAELKSRKWKLSPFMTKSEVVQTAFKAVMTAEEHETREAFKYRGRSVFGPHLDVDTLWEVSGRTDKRDSL